MEAVKTPPNIRGNSKMATYYTVGISAV